MPDYFSVFDLWALNVPGVVLRAPMLSFGARLLLALFIRNCNEAGEVKPNINRLCEMFSASPEDISWLIGELVTECFIEPFVDNTGSLKYALLQHECLEPRVENREFSPRRSRNRPDGPLKKPRRTPWDERRFALGNRSNWICSYCRKSGTPEVGPDGRTWHMDHLYAESLGGDDNQDNLVLACATCNISKKDKLLCDFLRSDRMTNAKD